MRCKFSKKFFGRSGSKVICVIGLLSIIFLLSGCSQIPFFSKEDRDSSPTEATVIELKRLTADVRRSDPLKGSLADENDNSVAWYQVVIPAAGKVACHLKQFSSNSHMSFGIYKSVNRSPLSSISVSGKDEKTITLDVQQGTHYVKVALKNGRTASEYEMFLEYDRNGTAAGATRISLNGKDPQGRLNDAQGDTLDWYRVNINGSQKGTFTYYIQQQSEANLFVEFYKSSGKSGILRSLTEERLITKKGGELSYPIEAQPGETYYAKVFLKRSGDSAFYSISNTFHPEESRPQPVAHQDKPVTTENEPQPVPTPAPAQPKDKVDRLDEGQPLQSEEPVIWLHSASPATQVQKDTTGNILYVETTGESLIIEGRATSPDGITQADIRIRCTKGCVVYQEEATATASPPSRDVNDLVILAPPPETKPQQEAQIPRNMQAFSKKLLLQEGENKVRVDAVDSVGRTLIHLFTVVRKASGN